MHRTLLSSRSESRHYIVDSGASTHLIGYKDLTDEEKGRIRSAKEPLILQTANGRAYAQDETDAYIHDLGIWVVFYILEDSPAVLSLGLLVEEHKFTYLWEPGEVPFLRSGAAGS